jgi:hypothetical protein
MQTELAAAKARRDELEARVRDKQLEGERPLWIG